MTSIFSNVTYPTNTTYQDRISAWVHFVPQNFSTRPDTRMEAKTVGANGAYILPLQRYTCPNQIGYENTEPSGLEMIGQGVRDIFTGGGLGKLSPIFMNAPIPGIGGLSLNSITDMIGGIKGAAVQDVSQSDLMFTSSQKRVHQFTFDLYAKNKQDAEAIDEIANGFQTRAYPFLEARNAGKITPPPMWKIKIVPSTGQNKSQVLDNHIQPSVLVNCTVSRLDSSTVATLTKDNYFIGVTLLLSFSEIEPTYRSYKNLEKLYSRAAAGSGSII